MVLLGMSPAGSVLKMILVSDKSGPFDFVRSPHVVIKAKPCHIRVFYLCSYIEYYVICLLHFLCLTTFKLHTAFLQYRVNKKHVS